MEKQIQKVKEKLWTYGYAAQDFSQFPSLNFDLIVSHNYQVRVISKIEDVGDSTYIYAIVNEQLGTITFIKYTAEGIIKTSSPGLIFGKPKE